jgi:glycosyltransferase involved in cell wall biosynthesis
MAFIVVRFSAINARLTTDNACPARGYNKNPVLKYSIVVPFHNEEENVTELYDRLKAVMEAAGDPFELVFVDDGSRDNTFWLLQQIASVDRRVVVVKLRRNFGQTSALAAGFDHAEGEYVIAMDGDLQHDPNDIPLFLYKLREGYDIVSGWRKQRIDNFVMRRIPSRIANWLMAKLSGVELHDFGTTFKAYRRQVVQEVPLYGELHRFIPALASAYGATICEIPIRNVNRERGESHYGISRTFRVFFDLITIRFLLRYMSRPLHFFGTFGALSSMTGMLIALWMLVEKLLYHVNVMDEHGPLLVFAAVLIVAGVQLIALGLLGELQVRHFHEPTKRVPYTVDRVLRSSHSQGALAD